MFAMTFKINAITVHKIQQFTSYPVDYETGRKSTLILQIIQLMQFVGFLKIIFHCKSLQTTEDTVFRRNLIPILYKERPPRLWMILEI